MSFAELTQGSAHDDLSAHNLLLRAQAGDHEAITSLYGRYAPEFYRKARIRGLTHEVAEDVVQIAFERILVNVCAYDGTKGAASGGAAWLRRICDNCVTDKLREQGRGIMKHMVAAPQQIMDSIVAVDHQPGEWLEDQERHWALLLAWHALTPADRALLLRLPKRGPRSRAWEAAAARFRSAFAIHYDDNTQTGEGYER